MIDVSIGQVVSKHKSPDLVLGISSRWHPPSAIIREAILKMDGFLEVITDIRKKISGSIYFNFSGFDFLKVSKDDQATQIGFSLFIPGFARNKGYLRLGGIIQHITVLRINQ